jgi:hypothetical protein
MKNVFVTALFLVVCCTAMVAVTSADEVAPYNTIVQGGDIGSARLVFGDNATAGINDALPAFTDVDAYEEYYKSDDNSDCDDACLRPVYRMLKSEGRMKMLMMGTRVRVTYVKPDPEDHRYEVCGIHLRDSSDSRLFIVICSGLKRS